MKIGWIGLGKLGLPSALAAEYLAAGELQIVGYDIDPRRREIVESRSYPGNYERGLPELLEHTRLELADSVEQVVAATDDLIFVAVQTPHDVRYGGEAIAPDRPADFDYRWLRAVAEQVNAAAVAQDRRVSMVVVSTALPGTMRREILPLLDENAVRLVYNPFFIAMGTTIADYCEPEFVLVGADDEGAREDVAAFYRKLYGATGKVSPILAMRIEEAELTKVAYNTFVSMKIVFANTLGEIADGLGTVDVDVVTGALGRAHKRLISPAYLTAGVGDGGACHCRDNQAMSWLAEELRLSIDPFRFVTRAREAQSQALADRVRHIAIAHDMPVVVLGKAYKAESTLTAGSPAALLVNQLLALGVSVQWWDPLIDHTPCPTGPNHAPAVYVVMTKHEVFVEAGPFTYPAGSIVVDPFRYLPEPADDVDVIALGVPKDEASR